MDGLQDHGLSDSAEEKELSALMRRTQTGDRESYGILLLRVKALSERYVKNSLRRMGVNASSAPPEDLVQEILLGLHSKRQTYNPAQYFLPWFYAIARYKMIDHLRDTRKRGHAVPLDDELGLLSDYPSPEAALAGRDTSDLLKILPKKQRTVLELVKVEGLSVAEASLRTGFSPSDIKVTVHRAIKSLKKALQETP